MKNNIKALELIESGLSSKTVSKLTESQINTLHKKMVGEQITTKATTFVSSKNPNAANIAKTLNTQGVDVSMTETDGEMEEGKTKKGEPNPWAICHAQVGPKKTRKFERCVMAVKKSLKEGKNPVTLFLENEIMRIVEKHIPPRITKGDLLKYLTESETAPAKPKTSPTTKPGKPAQRPKPGHPGKDPHPGTKEAPRAKKDDLEEDTTTAPSKPKTSPTTKPGKPAQRPKPGHPGKDPHPGTKEAPRATSPEKAKEEIINTIMKILK
jgi:hypothetical protein